MSNDARENYKAVFGVYPNESKQLNARSTEAHNALDFVLKIENAAASLQAMWEKLLFSDVSQHAQDQLKQIHAAAVALREEIAKTTSEESAH